MEKFGGYHENGNHVEVFIPTTIWDDCVASIHVSRGDHFDHISFELKKMPIWNTPHQCIELSKEDLIEVEKRTQELIERISDEH